MNVADPGSPALDAGPLPRTAARAPIHPRALAAAFVNILLTLVFGLASIAAALWNQRLASRLSRTWGRLLLRVWGVEVRLEGVEHVPVGPALYAANHVSTLDIPLVFGHLPVDFRIIHKRSIHLIPVVGLYLYLAGHIGIDRGRAFRARKSLERAAARIRSGTSVAVFPEGTRSPDGRLLPFKRGSFQLAIDAGVPVVPVSFRGVKLLVPGGLFTLRPGTVWITVHAPVPTRGRSREEGAALAAEVREIVEQGRARS